MRLNYDGFVDDILSVQRTTKKKNKRIKMPMGHRVFHVAKNYAVIGTFRPILLYTKHMDGYRGFVLKLSLSRCEM